MEEETIMRDSKKVAETLNSYFINIVEITTGNKPFILSCTDTGTIDDKTIDEIIERYSNHPSIENIKSNFAQIPQAFSFKLASGSDIEKVITKLSLNTAIGFDDIPPKLVKLAKHVISEPLSELINETLIQKCHFPSAEKIACVTPAFKKDNRLDKSNYRPISVLNVFSKIFERYLLQQMIPFFNNILSKFLSAYRKRYSCQHVLLRLIETWRKSLDENKLVGAILMDLSKAFDCLPHDLLIAKLEAYGFTKSALKLMLSYLSQRKQCVKNGSSLSLLKLILSGVPQGSILGPILFNIFLNDIFLLLDSDLHNFADDNTIAAIGETIENLVHSLETKSEIAIDWMQENKMIANPGKFKAIVLSKNNAETVDTKFQIRGKVLHSTDKVDLLGVTIDDKLSFEHHISEICRKAAGQLNALKRLGSYIPFETQKILADSFILSNFNYCPLVWYFSTAKQVQKIEKIQERVIRFVHNDYETDYSSLLKFNNSVTMEVKRMRYLCIEIYKTLHGLNPEYMKDLFQLSESRYSSRRPQDLAVPRVNQTRYGLRSIRYEGAKIWNHLPNSLKSAQNLDNFKNLIKTWEGPNCGCNFCKHVSQNSHP